MNFFRCFMAVACCLISACSPLKLHTGVVSDANFDSFKPDLRFARLASLVYGHELDSKSLSEFYVSERELFSKDKLYPCRHPSFASYFAEKLSTDLDEGFCSSLLPLRILDRNASSNVRWLDPARVREIHLLYASPGVDVISGFGHVSLRLIVCPDLDSSKLDCDENLAEHLVLGFAAEVNEFDLALWKGVFGGYEASLVATPFLENYHTNTIVEDRHLYSLPLKLNQHEVRKIVRELVEVHWSFKGDYRFFTNNCATFLQDTLSTLFPADMAEHTKQNRSIRPDVFFESLSSSDLVDASVLDSLKQAEKEGYYFPSNWPYYRQAYDFVFMNSGVWPQGDTLSEYILLPAEQRNALIKKVRRKHQKGGSGRSREALILLEELALLISRAAMEAELTTFIKEGGLELVRSDDAGDVLLQPNSFIECLRVTVEMFHKGPMKAKGIPSDQVLRRLEINQPSCMLHLKIAVLEEYLFESLVKNDSAAAHIRTLLNEMRSTELNLKYLRAL